MATIGFLHTSAMHVPTFEALLSDVDPAAVGLHACDPGLLNDARARGVDADVRTRLVARLRQLAARDPAVLVCTCSTLGGAAELLGSELGLPVLRVDRPMAEQAVALGRRVAVVAAVESTLQPTRALLEESAAAAGVSVTVLDELCPDAWPLFESGDHHGYLTAVARQVRAAAADADVVVLAQASMASAVGLLPDLGVPVLSSPRVAVERAVAQAALLA